MSRLGRLSVWLPFSALLGWGLYDFYLNVALLGNVPTLQSKRFSGFLLGALLFVLVWGYATLQVWRGARSSSTDRALARLERIPLGLRAVLAVILTLLPSYLLVYSSFGLYKFTFGLRLSLLILAALAAAVLLRPRFDRVQDWLVLGALAGLTGAWLAAAGWLSRVTSYPFNLSWSEGNRFWDYSTLFGASRYIHPAEQPIFAFISPGRKLLWALVFLIPNATIWMVRLWDALLWILPPLGLGWAMVAGRSVARHNLLWQVGLVVWSFLFLAQGPVYAPLVVCAILVVLALRSRWLWLSVLIVLLAGFYAHLSRWTWTYAPGLWAGMFALLDAVDPALQKLRWKQFIRPVVLGVAGYLGGEIVYAFWKVYLGGSSTLKLSVLTDASSKVTRQPLLWERLLPNTTYAPGLLLGILWAALPVLLLLLWLVIRRRWALNPWQKAGLFIPTAAFFGVGLVISTKIGGGSNLHNLDMFWVTLVLMLGWAWKSVVPGAAAWPLNLKRQAALLTALALFFPAAYAFQYSTPLVLPAAEDTQQALDNVRSRVSRTLKQGGEILFIDDRQLLTFGQVENVPLIADYEKKYMMDQAMAGDSAYFQSFYRDLAAQRFALIVSEPLAIRYQGSENTFGEENDAFVQWVSAPILCYYQPVQTDDAVGMQLLAPRAQPSTNRRCPKP